MAMWDIYSNKDSIALKIKAKDLIDYFNSLLKQQPGLFPKLKFICGSVSYFRLNPFDPFEKGNLPKYSAFVNGNYNCTDFGNWECTKNGNSRAQGYWFKNINNLIV